MCPVDSIVNSGPKRDSLEENKLDALDPCVCKYVLTHEALAKLRLGVRSDVIRTRDVDAVTYDGLRKNFSFRQTRIVLIPYWAFPISATSFYYPKKFFMQPKGATKAYRRSQSLISSAIHRCKRRCRQSSGNFRRKPLVTLNSSPSDCSTPLYSIDPIFGWLVQSRPGRRCILHMAFSQTKSPGNAQRVKSGHLLAYDT